MAFFRRTFSRRLLPDRFQEITERVYVFDCCLSTKELSEQDYRTYMDTAVTNLQKHHPGASFMVFNFKEGDDPSELFDILSHHDMTVVDYPRHYEGYPILPLEMIHYFLRSSDSWLSLEGQRNVILMHCERGGWPVLAFMLAGLLLYSKKQVGEQKTLEMVYKQAPKELLMPLSIMNPRPSQLRYLQYISGRSLTSDWPPADAPLVIDSIVLMNIPLFDGGKGCRPIVHVYGQDPSMKSNRRPRLLFSSLMAEEGAHYYHREDCLMVKINLNSHVQGDVFLECIHLGDDLVSEEKIFKVMFHTAFVQSYIMLLSSSEVDVLWNANGKIPSDFKAEVFFSNPEEVLLSIAKEVASLEEGHESESEFFEAGEFEIPMSQDHNKENLMSQEGTHLDHQNEDKQEKLDASSVKSIEVVDDALNPGEQASFDGKEKNEHSMKATVSQEQNLEQALKVDYEPILNLSNEQESYQATEADFHPSVKGNYILNEYEANVANESTVEVNGRKAQDTSQATFSVSCSKDELDLKQANVESDFETYGIIKNDSIVVGVAKRSQEDGSELASSPVICEANTKVFVVEEITKDGSAEITKDGSASAYAEANTKINDASKSFLLLEEDQEDCSKAQFGGSEDLSKASPLEVSFEPNIVLASSLVVHEDNTKVFVVEEMTKDGTSSAYAEANTEINGASKSILLLEEDQEVAGREDLSKASPLEASFEPNIAFEGSESEAIVVSKNIVVTEGSKDDSKTVLSSISTENAILVGGSQDITKVTSSEVGLELNSATKNFLVIQETQEGSSRAGSDCDVEVEERSEHDGSDISSSEIESENCTMSKSLISHEGSEDSSETTSSQTGSELVVGQATSSQTGPEFLVTQATSSDAKSELHNASKHIVVVTEDSEEHEVKVLVQPKATDDRSKGLQQKKMNKKKPRLADAVAKVTMQRRVISVWVPRANPPTPEDTKQKAPVYKWVPKESVSTSEET